MEIWQTSGGVYLEVSSANQPSSAFDFGRARNQVIPPVENLRGSFQDPKIVQAKLIERHFVESIGIHFFGAKGRNDSAELPPRVRTRMR